MGRLTNLSPRFGTLPPRVARRSDAHGHHPAAEPWRKWYCLKAWADLRRRVFVRDGYACRLCGQVTERLIADHDKPHRGDPALFWNEGNVQSLCKPCHDSVKQAAERRGGGGG